MSSGKYPIGIQSFEKLRTDGYLYVDKTSFVYELTRGSGCYFLSRPRRFGKSLFLSTIEAYFQGRKDLFNGLAIETLEKDWQSYPVLRFDFSTFEGESADKLEKAIIENLRNIAAIYGVVLKDESLGVGILFGYLIEDVAKATGKRVVVLIDEYDKGILEVMEHEDQLKKNEALLRGFFTQLKAQDKYLRFSMLTGVARFRHLTIFSGLNNMDDISLDRKYADVCGITNRELIGNFEEGIMSLSRSLGTDITETVEILKQKYDGYRFTKADSLVYNPFSLLNCLSKGELSNYWVKSGASNVFLTYFRQSDFSIVDLEDCWATQNTLESMFDVSNPIPLLFQCGYLTITGFSGDLFRLNIPNGEVRGSLVDELIPRFMGVSEASLNQTGQAVKNYLENGDVDSMMCALQSMVAKIPYQELDLANLEKIYHLVIYQLFLFIGVNTRSEISIAGGRIDMVAETRKYVYVFEFKLDDNPKSALEQINKKGYALPWKADRKSVIKVGVSFSRETRTIDSWLVERDDD